MFAEVGGLVLHYRLEGPPKAPPLVFINSLGSDLRIWDEVAPSFGDYLVLRFDKRGHGLSDAPEGPYRLEDFSADLLALLEQLGLSEVNLVGISIGGIIALDFALRYPQRVRSLVLCDTGAKIGTSEAWAERTAAIEEKGLAEVAKTVIARWFAQDFAARRPADYRGYLTMLSRTPEAGYLGACAALEAADLRADVGRIRAPSLVLCGSEDASTPPELSEALRAAIGGARLEWIPGAGHLPCVEQPHLVTEAVGRFLEEHNV